ncbi:MAG: hypothetical protein J7L80_04880 [Thermoplasmata archaeon]|nr:hypothetical protein [Thermoplasmata archaeon]
MFFILFGKVKEDIPEKASPETLFHFLKEHTNIFILGWDVRRGKYGRNREKMGK